MARGSGQGKCGTAASRSGAISRAEGTPITISGQPTGQFAGGGFSGASVSLDETVQIAGELLADAYEMDVQIRFNSDRKSGGAWLRTSVEEGIGRNAEIGICAVQRHLDEADRAREHQRNIVRLGQETADEIAELGAKNKPGTVTVFAHISARALIDKTLANEDTDEPERAYYHGVQPSLEAALAFVQAHAALS
jgi:hypothetical protein